jgi:hypothetical protein
MSDDHDDPPAQEPQERSGHPRPAHEHHGVVETLREELHEVAGHVPQPVRWTVGKLARIALLSLVALVVVALVSAIAYLANRTELVAHELTLLLNHTLAQQSDLVLEMSDIKGNPFTGFRVIEPRVLFRDGGGTLLEAHQLRVTYGAFSLLRGGRGPLNVVIEQPDVHLDLGAARTWRLPRWTGSPAKKGSRPRALDFSLELRDATVSAPKPLEAFAGLDLVVKGSTGSVAHVDLSRLRWRAGPWHSRLEDLQGALVADADSTRFTLRRLRTADLALTASGGWRTGGGNRRLHIDVERLRWSWLGQVFDNRSFGVPGEGAATFDVLGGRNWGGTFRSSVTWDSLAAAASGRFTWDGHELVVDSLAGRSAAGDLLGHLHWSKKSWEVGGDATGADPSKWRALHLVNWPAGRLNGRFLYHVDIPTKARAESRLTANLVGSEWAKWRVDSAVVRVDFPAVARDSFSVTGWRRGGTFTLRAGIDPGRWEGPCTIEDLPLEEWPDGRASGLRGVLDYAEGRVESRAGQLFVTGDLSGSGTDWSAAHFATWELTDVRGRLLPTPDLTASARARDGFFTGIHLDSAAAPIRLGDARIDFTSLHAVAGDTLVSLDGGATWAADRWRLTASRATVTSAQLRWKAEPPLVIAGDREGTLCERVLADDGAAHLEARGRWAAPGGFYDFAMDARNLEVGRLGMPLDWGLGGSADARLVVTGRSGDPKWAFEGRAAEPAFAGHRGDSLSLSLAGEQHMLRVNDLLFTLDGGDLRAAGSVERAPRAWPDSLTATAVTRWLQVAESWRGEVTARRFPLDHLGAFSPPAAGWAGRLDATLAVAGSPPAPELDLRATASDIGWRDYRAQRLEAGARYEGGVLSVPDTRITMLDVVSTVRGRMPLRLALGRVPELPDEPMSWRVEVPKGDLKLLPALVPLFQTAHGRFDLDATLAGTTRHPKVTGVGHVREGTIRPAGREEILEGVYADLHFDESRVTLDTLAAKQGRSGRVWSKGVVDLAEFGLKSYRFDLAMRDFASRQEGLYAMLFDGDFEVIDGPRVQGERLPQVTGDVRLKRGVIEFDFANQNEVQARAATTEPLYWTYRIHVEAPSNLRWRPPDGDIEFDADLDLEQTPDSLLIYGEMHLVRGHYFFLSNRFALTQADVTFDNQQGVDPLLAITADTRLLPSQSHGAVGGAKPHIETFTVQIAGRSSQPVITLSGPEGYDQTAILAELTYGRFAGTTGLASAADPLQNYVTRQLTNQLSKDLSKYLNNAVTQWTVEREQGALFGGGGAGDVYVGVSGDVNPRTSWTYTQRVPGLNRGSTSLDNANPFERDVAVEYRLNRFIYVTTELLQRRTSLVPVPTTTNGPAEFNVSLKARWEY